MSGVSAANLYIWSSTRGTTANQLLNGRNVLFLAFDRSPAFVNHLRDLSATCIYNYVYIDIL